MPKLGARRAIMSALARSKKAMAAAAKVGSKRGGRGKRG